MAGFVYETLKTGWNPEDGLQVEIIQVFQLEFCASIIGSPLMTDFAVLMMISCSMGGN